jgi:TolB protein
VENPAPIPPATGHIIFASDRDGQTDLYMTTADGLETVRLTTGAAVEEGDAPKLSPDGTKIAFVGTIADNTDIYVLDIASGSISRITDSPGRDSSPSWSPDSQHIVFESFRDGNLEIYVVNTDGSNLIRLTNDTSGDSNPVWSPNPNDILFSSHRFGNQDLFLVGLNGSLATLTTNPEPDNNAAWSPDGNFIAYLAYKGELSDLCLIARDGSNKTCLTNAPVKFETPVWSPDGTWIAVNSGTSIHVFNRLTGEVRYLSKEGVEPRGIPAWSPDGLRLVFQTLTNGDMELYHAVLQTNEFTQITSVPGFDGKPVWSAR